MDLTLGARKLLSELVKAEQLEVRRLEIVGRDLVRLCETLKRPPTGSELEDWLELHAQVTELYAATSLLDELVERHLTPPVANTFAEARHLELENQLRDAPDTTEPYLVYADWLQERGDPFGELVALGVATHTEDPQATVRFERHLKRYQVYLLGEHNLGERVVLHWRHGFVRAIEDGLAPLDPKLWQQLLGLRVCELLESITLQHQVTPAIDEAIAATAPPAFRSLTLEDRAGIGLPPHLIARPLRSLAINAAFRIAIESTTLPRSLERLELRVAEIQVTTPPVELDVHELEVELDLRMVQFLTIARLPHVERLVLHLAPATTPALPALLATLDPPVLRHLALRGDAVPRATLAAVAELPLARRLWTLALIDVGLTDELVPTLAEPLRKFSALTELDLDLNELSRDGLAAARELAPTVTSHRQHRRGNAMERRIRKFAGSRLQAAEAITDPKAWKRAFVDGDLRWARYRGEAEYELFVSADLARYGCSCPSSIQPCKHVGALALVAERMTLASASSNRIEERVGRRLADALRASIESSD